MNRNISPIDSPEEISENVSIFNTSEMDNGPIFNGECPEAPDEHCMRCGEPLITDVAEEQIRGGSFQCPNCDQWYVIQVGVSPYRIRYQDEQYGQANPSFRLVPVVQTPTVNPGETILINLYAVGYGRIDKADLKIIYDHPNLVDPAHVGRMAANSWWIHSESAMEPVPFPGTVQTRDIEQSAAAHMQVSPLFWTSEQIRQGFETIEGMSLPDYSLGYFTEDMYDPIAGSKKISIVDDEILEDKNFADHRDDLRNFDSFDESDERLPPIRLELNTLPAKPPF